jgi:CP family cyanate transporter-like MFS transporter
VSLAPAGVDRPWTTGLAEVLLVAACMRPAITAVGPVLSRIGHSEGLSHVGLGLLSALPLIAFAGMSPVVHAPARRYGVERLILWALIALTAGIVLRSVGGAPGRWTGTLVVGIGVAVCNVLMPVVVRSGYAARIALVTGLYSAALSVAAAAASGVSLPLAGLGGRAGGWRLSLGVWSLLTAGTALVWGRRVHRRARTAAVETVEVQAVEVQGGGGPAAPVEPAPERSVWRTGSAWRITAFMGLQSTSFYVFVSWFPAIAVDRDVSASLAGWYLFAAQVVGIFSGLTLPLLLNRTSRQVSGVAVSLPMALAAVGLVVAPGAMPLWVLCIGLSTGSALVLALSMIGLAARGSGHGAQLSGMAQAVGYGVAATGPVLAGYLRDATGSWDAALVLLAGVAVTQALVAAAPAPRIGAAVRHR